MFAWSCSCQASRLFKFDDTSGIGLWQYLKSTSFLAPRTLPTCYTSSSGNLIYVYLQIALQCCRVPACYTSLSLTYLLIVQIAVWLGAVCCVVLGAAMVRVPLPLVVFQRPAEPVLTSPELGDLDVPWIPSMPPEAHPKSEPWFIDKGVVWKFHRPAGWRHGLGTKDTMIRVQVTLAGATSCVYTAANTGDVPVLGPWMREEARRMAGLAAVVGPYEARPIEAL